LEKRERTEPKSESQTQASFWMNEITWVKLTMAGHEGEDREDDGEIDRRGWKVELSSDDLDPVLEIDPSDVEAKGLAAEP
jgi:hypothetical protein